MHASFPHAIASSAPARQAHTHLPHLPPDITRTPGAGSLSYLLAYGLDGPAVRNTEVSVDREHATAADEAQVQRAWKQAQHHYGETGGPGRHRPCFAPPAAADAAPADTNPSIGTLALPLQAPAPDSLDPASRIATNLVHYHGSLFLKDLDLQLPQAREDSPGRADQELQLAAAAYILGVEIPERHGCHLTPQRSRVCDADFIFRQEDGGVVQLMEDLRKELFDGTIRHPPAFASARETAWALVYFDHYVDGCIERIHAMGAPRDPSASAHSPVSSLAAGSLDLEVGALHELHPALAVLDQKRLEITG